MGDSSSGDAEPQFLMHEPGDTVAVAVQDVDPGTASGAVLSTGERRQLPVTERIPLGHKFAVEAVAEGAPVTEYGFRVGTALQPIAAGEHVHVHNLGSSRWQTSRVG